MKVNRAGVGLTIVLSAAVSFSAVAGGFTVDGNAFKDCKPDTEAMGELWTEHGISPDAHPGMTAELTTISGKPVGVLEGYLKDREIRMVLRRDDGMSCFPKP